MSYISLYRKYRSQSFGEVIGQSHVTTVLQNAIRQGRIAHAYLFTGPRGCGKTSTARLLARALTCVSSDGPTADPCGTCSLCVGIRDGNALDIIEMDAASETGIDDVREKIIENAKFAPAEARYKVYIIDEVHDLSQKAFDSLLKTIEEPPAHVVFILATTESHKVPITIRSRCQRLDFRRARIEDLVANLRRVLEAEGIAHDEAGLLAVAKAADGSFRDSLSLLEQVVAFTDGALTADAVHEAAGTVGQEMLDEVTRSLIADDLNGAFVKAGDLAEAGKDVKQLLIALQGHLRDLMVAQVAKTPQAIPEVTAERFAHLREQAAAFKPAQILRMIEILAQAERDVRFTNQHRLLLERAFWSILPSSLAIQESATKPATTARTPATAKTTPEHEMRIPTAPLPKLEADPTVPVAKPGGTVDIDVLRRLWPKIIQGIRQASPSASAYFVGVYPQSLDRNTIVLGFPNEFNRSFVDSPKRAAVVTKVIQTHLGVSGIKLRCVLADPEDIREPSAPPSALDFAGEEPPVEAVTVPAKGGNGAAPDSGPSLDGELQEESLLSVVESEFQGKLLDD